MLTLRKRGETWHARGTVRVGAKVWEGERTTGRRDKGEADAVRVQIEAEIQADLLAGRDPNLRGLTFDDVGGDYLKRPQGVDYADEDRIIALSEHFGSTAVIDIDAAAWRRYCTERLPGRSPGTWNRHRTVLRAILERSRLLYKYPMPEIPAEPYNPIRVRFLQRPKEERRLLDAYTGPARDPLHFMASTGRRTGEVLKLDRREVDVGRKEAFFPDPKGGSPQACILFPLALAAVRRALKSPIVTVTLDDGRKWQPLFLSQRGEPYAVWGKKGGNPLSQAHATACRNAGIEDFHPHDWRHHVATWLLREGWQESQIMRQCGWSSAEMLHKYAAVVLDDLHDLRKRRRA